LIVPVLLLRTWISSLDPPCSCRVADGSIPLARTAVCSKAPLHISSVDCFESVSRFPVCFFNSLSGSNEISRLSRISSSSIANAEKLQTKKKKVPSVCFFQLPFLFLFRCHHSIAFSVSLAKCYLLVSRVMQTNRLGFSAKSRNCGIAEVLTSY
jgi:hypothetical protein